MYRGILQGVGNAHVYRFYWRCNPWGLGHQNHSNWVMLFLIRVLTLFLYWNCLLIIIKLPIIIFCHIFTHPMNESTWRPYSFSHTLHKREMTPMGNWCEWETCHYCALAWAPILTKDGHMELNYGPSCAIA